jgi:hypothetical protein
MANFVRRRWMTSQASKASMALENYGRAAKVSCRHLERCRRVLKMSACWGKAEMSGARQNDANDPSGHPKSRLSTDLVFAS